MHLIVGIDPGKNVGVSCLNLDGKLIRSAHKDGGGMEWAIEVIRETGIPALISTDKHRQGSFVKKLGAVFNVSVFYPDKDMNVREKREMTKTTNITNPHERDAFASAVKAFNEYKDKLAQAESIARKTGSSDTDRIKALVIRKFSIDEALHSRPANRA